MVFVFVFSSKRFTVYGVQQNLRQRRNVPAGLQDTVHLSGNAFAFSIASELHAEQNIFF